MFINKVIMKLRPGYSSFTKALRPFYIACKVLGMANFSWNVQTNKFKTSLINHFTMFAFVVLRTSLLIMWLLELSAFDSGLNSKFIDGTYVVAYVVKVAAIPLIILFQHCKRKHVIRFIKLIEKFDAKFNLFNWNFKVAETSVYYMTYIYATFLIVILSDFFYYYKSLFILNDFYSSILKLAYCFISSTHATFSVILSLRFILASYCILTRLRVLNRNVR